VYVLAIPTIVVAPEETLTLLVFKSTILPKLDVPTPERLSLKLYDNVDMS